MNYLTENRRHALAAAYVLGTLGGPARRRFQRLILEHVRVHQTVWQWERRLNELGAALLAQTPHPRVWTAIQARLGIGLRGTRAGELLRGMQ